MKKKPARPKRKAEKKHRSYRRDAADELAKSVLVEHLEKRASQNKGNLSLQLLRAPLRKAPTFFEGPDVEFKKLFGRKLKLKQVKSIAYDLELIAYFATVWSVYANAVVFRKYPDEAAVRVALKAGLSLWKNLLGRDFEVGDQTPDDRLRAALSR